MTKQDERPIRIVRTPHTGERPYFSVARATAQDNALSYEALGVLIYLLSKPDGWEADVRDIAKRSSTYKAYKVFRELRKQGYMSLEKETDKGRFTKWVYQVYEINPFIENQQMENPQMEIRHTHIVQKELDTTELNTLSGKPERIPAPQKIPAAVMNPMKDAIAFAFSWQWEKMTGVEKGVIQKTAKELCEAGIQPQEVGDLYTYCAKQFDNFSPRALASNLSTYRAMVDKAATSEYDIDNLKPLNAGDNSIEFMKSVLANSVDED